MCRRAQNIVHICLSVSRIEISFVANGCCSLSSAVLQTCDGHAMKFHGFFVCGCQKEEKKTFCIVMFVGEKDLRMGRME